MKIRTIAEFLKRLAKTKKRKWKNYGYTIRCEDYTCPVMAVMGEEGAGYYSDELPIEEGLARRIMAASDLSPASLCRKRGLVLLRRRILKTLGLNEA